METNRVQFDSNAVSEKVDNNNEEPRSKIADRIGEKLEAGDGTAAFKLIGSGIDVLRKDIRLIHSNNVSNLRVLNDKLNRVESKLELIDERLLKLMDTVESDNFSSNSVPAVAEFTYEDLYKMHEAGKSYQKIADLTNIDKETVRYRINAYKKKNGIQP